MKVEATDIEFIVNDLGELGVRVEDTFVFLYKGRSLQYTASDNRLWRPVYKREFGETCQPLEQSPYYRREPDGRYLVEVDGEPWRPIPESKS